MKLPLASIAACGLAGLALPAVARADVTPVGPFPGDAWESFEAVGNQGSYQTLELFEGDALASNSFNAGVIVASSLYNFPNDIEITAYNGNYFLGSPVALLRIQFDFPVHAVGAYITNAGPGFQTSDTSMLAAAEFFDATGASMGTAEPYSIVFGEWTWHGWTSDEPFQAVAFSAGSFPGEIVAIDDLVYSLTPVPEPSAALLAGLAGALLLRRRRA